MLVIAAGTANIHLAVGAIFPAVLAAVEWFRRPGRRMFVVEPHGLADLDGGGTIPYETIREVTVNGVDWCPVATPEIVYPILIHHERGVLTLPPRLSIPADQFREFLRVRAPVRDSRECPAPLAAYLAENVAKFGPEKVTLIPGRRRFHAAARWYWMFSVSLAMVLTGGLWLAIGLGFAWFPNPHDGDAWAVAGVSALIIGAPFWMLAAWSSTADGKHRKFSKNAGIVISPAGMAMTQGPLQGSMPWEEIRKVNHIPGGNSITLTVPGATLMILNIYERSLDEIAMLIRRNAL